MEKHLYGSRPSRKNGLLKQSAHTFIPAAALILFFFLTAPLLPAAETAAADKDLHFYLSESVSAMQTHTDYTFIALLPAVKPAQAEVLFPAPPANTFFTGFEKTAKRDGTKLTYSVRFIQAGTIQLPPLQIRVGEKTHTAVFPALTVSENPSSLVPEFFLTADTEAEAGKPLRIYLMGRHFRHIRAINLKPAEDALLEQSASILESPSQESFDFNRDNTVSAVRIAEFLYTPFSQGIREFPQTEVKAEAYDGNVHTVPARPLTLNVSPSDERSPAGQKRIGLSKSEEQALQEAVFQKKIEDKKIQQNSLRLEERDTAAIALQLAKLRAYERRSPFFWKFRRERKNLEQKMLLQNPDETPLFWTLTAAIIFCILPLPVFVLLKRKRAKKIGFSLIALGCLCFVFVLKGIRQSAKPAFIAHRAVLRTIPEKTALGTAALQEGTRLKMLHKSGDWYLIAAGERSGWILKSEVIPIGNTKDK